MAITPLPEVIVTAIAYFPEKYFPENLIVRTDGSVLITAVLQKELWYVPGPARTLTDPVLVHAFDHPVTGIVEVEPGVFVLSLTEGYTTHECHLVRLDLRDWTPGTPVTPEVIFTFDERARALNGSCLLGPTVMAVADCFAGLIWRVDLTPGAHSATARVWLAHDTMAEDPDSEIPWPPQPGINGLRYGARTGYLYYTSTARRRCSCASPSTRPRLTRPAAPSSSRPSTTQTTSASTKTPASPTSPATAPTPSTASRLPHATAARYATCSATRSTR